MRDTARNAYSRKGTPGSTLHESRQQLKRLAFAALALSFAFAPLVATGLLVTRVGKAPPEIDPPPVAELAAVVEVEVRDEVVANAVLAQGTAHTLRSPGHDGNVVTAVYVQPGNTVHNGEPIYAVDGRDVLLAVTDEPFHRPLSLGSTGADVLMLQRWLSGWSHVAAPAISGRFDTTTRLAVVALNTSRGETEPASLPVFQPSAVVWSDTPFETSSVGLVIGDLPPPMGSAIALGPTAMMLIGFESPSGEALELEGEWEWSVANTVIGILADGRPSEEQLAQAIELSWEQVSNSVEFETRIPSLFRSVDAAVRRAVPVGTVITSAEGVCLFIRDADHYRPLATTVTGGDFGRVWIDPAPPPGTQVLANPLLFLTNPTCAS